MSIKAYIPGTQERAKVQLGKALRGVQSGHEVLLEIEWPDGSMSYEPADWIEMFGGYKGANTGLIYFARGQGKRAKNASGANLVQVYAPNAGVVSTESALIADKRANEDYRIEVNGEPYKKDDNGDWVHATAETELVADGGTLDIDDKLLDLCPHGAKVDTSGRGDPEVDFDFAGQAYSLKESSDYDPNPVNALDVKAIIDYVRASETDQVDLIKWAAIGFIGGAGIILFTFFMLWLLGQFGGGGAAQVGVGTGLLMLLGRPEVDDDS